MQAQVGGSLVAQRPVAGRDDGIGKIKSRTLLKVDAILKMLDRHARQGIYGACIPKDTGIRGCRSGAVGVDASAGHLKPAIRLDTHAVGIEIEQIRIGQCCLSPVNRKGSCIQHLAAVQVDRTDIRGRGSPGLNIRPDSRGGACVVRSEGNAGGIHGAIYQHVLAIVEFDGHPGFYRQGCSVVYCYVGSHDVWAPGHIPCGI